MSFPPGGLTLHRPGTGTPANPVAFPVPPTRTTELVAHLHALAQECDELSRQTADWATRDVGHDNRVAITAHDLQNALTVIKGNAQLILRHLATSTGSADQIGAAMTQLERSVAATAQVLPPLHHVRGDAPFLRWEPHPCDVVALVRQVARDHRALTERHQIRVRSATPALVGMWDARGLTRVVGNLLANAIKYSPNPGEIVVTLAPAPVPTGRGAVLAVRDHGIGIPPAELPHLFRPFQRAANVGLMGGTGLGLASVQQIVELAHGTITVASHEGIGTTITIRLPLARPAASVRDRSGEERAPERETAPVQRGW